MRSMVSGRPPLKTYEIDQSEVVNAISGIGGLVPTAYDYIALTYVAAGAGVGEIETVTYKTGGGSGTTVAVLTLTYDVDNKLSSVTKA